MFPMLISAHNRNNALLLEMSLCACVCVWLCDNSKRDRDYTKQKREEKPSHVIAITGQLRKCWCIQQILFLQFWYMILLSAKLSTNTFIEMLLSLFMTYDEMMPTLTPHTHTHTNIRKISILNTNWRPDVLAYHKNGHIWANPFDQRVQHELTFISLHSQQCWVQTNLQYNWASIEKR